MKENAITKNVIYATTFANLANSIASGSPLGILTRDQPHEAIDFFARLQHSEFTIRNIINAKFAQNEIHELFSHNFSTAVISDSFYKIWVQDISQAIKFFCKLQNTTSLSFWLSSKRVCQKFHVDKVNLRLLITYSGIGTEWLPLTIDQLHTLKNIETQKSNFINPWDIAIFRGKSQGFVHRTPTAALISPSILLRLDHPDFFIIK